MEDFVTFELAKKLKEKGFIGNGNIGCCFGFYCEEGLGINIVYDDLDNSELLCNEYLRPSISQVLKWLREEKRLHINSDISEFGWTFQVSEFTIVIDDDCMFEINYIVSCSGEYKSYEEAALAGIEYVLDNLI